MPSTLTFAIILTLLPSALALICGQTACNRDGYDRAYCCGYKDDSCCRSSSTSTVISLWWFWLIIIVSVLSIGLCISWGCCRHYRRSRIPYIAQCNANTAGSTTVVQSNQSHVTQMPASIPQNMSPYPVHQGYDPNHTTAPAYVPPPGTGTVRPVEHVYWNGQLQS